MKKKILMLIMILIMIPSMLLLESCRLLNRKDYICGDFKYTIIEGKNNKKMAAIIKLSEEGETKKVVVVPEYLDGYKVYGLYDSLSELHGGFINSDNLEKLYINFEFKNNYNKISVDKVLTMDPTYISKTIVSSDYYKTYVPSTINVDTINDGVTHVVNNANVTYYSNYGDNDIYWIDDYENEELITYIPEEPKREGYTFDGWYKESECINKWDFDIDKVPGKNYYKDIDYFNAEYNTYKFYQMSNYDYMETKLYAKWIEE